MRFEGIIDPIDSKDIMTKLHGGNWNEEFSCCTNLKYDICAATIDSERDDKDEIVPGKLITGGYDLFYPYYALSGRDIGLYDEGPHVLYNSDQVNAYDWEKVIEGYELKKQADGQYAFTYVSGHLSHNGIKLAKFFEAAGTRPNDVDKYPAEFSFNNRFSFIGNYNKYGECYDWCDEYGYSVLDKHVHEECTSELEWADSVRADMFAVRDTSGNDIDPVYIGTLSGNYEYCLEILGYMMPGWLNVVRQYRTDPDRATAIAKSGDIEGWRYDEEAANRHYFIDNSTMTFHALRQRSDLIYDEDEDTSDEDEFGEVDEMTTGGPVTVRRMSEVELAQYNTAKAARRKAQFASSPFNH